MRKAPNTKDIANDHKFQINPKYTNPRVRVPVPTLSVSRPKKDEELNESLYRLRRHQMDAAIVREMKRNKSMKHNDLKMKVYKRLRARFTPKPKDIKKRIANLIALEYLERDEKDRNLYHYKY